MTEAPPPGAVVLFDGRDLSAFRARKGGGPARWPLQNDGSVLTRGGDIISRQEFGDHTLHLEFRIPRSPFFVPAQLRGNSGVYLHGRYEIQVLDAWGRPETLGNRDCGAVYLTHTPLRNASRPPGEWQTYDITFRAPRFGPAGRKTEDARLTAYQNGVLIHDDVALPCSTPGGLGADELSEGPLMLQDHFCPVRFRNVWVAG